MVLVLSYNIDHNWGSIRIFLWSNEHGFPRRAILGSRKRQSHKVPNQAKTMVDRSTVLVLKSITTETQYTNRLSLPSTWIFLPQFRPFWWIFSNKRQIQIKISEDGELSCFISSTDLKTLEYLFFRIVDVFTSEFASKIALINWASFL